MRLESAWEDLVSNKDFSGRAVEKCFCSESASVAAVWKIKDSEVPVLLNSLEGYSLLLGASFQTTWGFESHLWKNEHIHI